MQGQLIDECTNELTGLTVRHGGYFRPGSTEILNPDRARELCSGYWNHDSFRNIAWLIVALRTRFSTCSLPSAIDPNFSPRPLFRLHCILVLPAITRSLHCSHCANQRLPHASTRYVPTTAGTNTRLRAIQPLSGLRTALRSTQAPDLLARWVVRSHRRREERVRAQYWRGEHNAPQCAGRARRRL
jgi:hypothetical protein